MILSEFEEFFELKFSKPAKLVRKITDNTSNLPKIVKKAGSFVNSEQNSKKSSKSFLFFTKKTRAFFKEKIENNKEKAENNKEKPENNKEKPENNPELIEITGNSIVFLFFY